jgi:enterochelin esterase family protein
VSGPIDRPVGGHQFGDGATAADAPDSNVMRDGMHDWVIASENMARVLAARGYDYQFVFARNAVHVDRGVKEQTLPVALEWLWKDYPSSRR